MSYQPERLVVAPHPAVAVPEMLGVTQSQAVAARTRLIGVLVSVEQLAEMQALLRIVAPSLQRAYPPAELRPRL